MKRMRFITVSWLLLASVLFAEQKSFSQRAIEAARHIVESIKQQPFLLELANGTLCSKKFHYFEVQDKIYCQRYADSLLDLADKAPTLELKEFLEHASDGARHEWPGPVPNMPQCPSCVDYSDFEEAAVAESFTEGLAALSPCYIVYWQVAEWLRKHMVLPNPYQYWIARYSKPNYPQSPHKHKKSLN